MTMHTIKLRINEGTILNLLTDVLAEQVSDEVGENIDTVKGMRKAIKADAKALLPRYIKTVLSKIDWLDVVDDINDELLGWPGDWAPLAKLVKKYSDDSDLWATIEESQRVQRIERVLAEAEELGLTITK